jgi:8-oxo-dGTP pyrophosphatase MutT (NUDIX family)
MSDTIDPNKIPIPASTTVLVRDGHDGVEVLLARRNTKLFFAGGAWVFPGGRIDPEDHEGEVVTDDDDPRMLQAARTASAREALEEVGAVIDAESLVWLSHWTPPMEAPRRFSTWFFMAPAPEHIAGLEADGGEIHELAWMRPFDAMRGRNEGEIELIPPTFITLAILDRFTTAEEALEHYRTYPPEHFVTKFASDDGDMVALYEGDAGYESGDATTPGIRHRLRMGAGEWSYERTDWP